MHQPVKARLINDTIEKNKRIFKIPVYQRNYDWTNNECEKLYKDIIEAYKKDKMHFTGTIVYIVGEYSASPLTEDLIIDGQQRITSMMILLKALLDVVNEKKLIHLSNEIEELLFNRHCDEQFKLKLKPVKADNAQFKALMENDVDLYDTNSNIIRNYNRFKELINASLNEGIYLEDIFEGMKKLEVIEIVLDKSEGDNPQEIFESINSTGVALSLADKIRNFVLMDEKNQDTLYEKYWLVIEEKVGNKNLADYFITYLDYKMSYRIAQKNAYEMFKKFFYDENLTHEEVLKDLQRYAKYYSAFIGNTNPYGYKISKLLEDFRSIDQSTIYIFLFDIFDDYERGNINEVTLLKVLSFFRSYSVRRIICERTSNSLRGLYKTLYSRLFKNDKNYEKYYEKIYTFFKTTKTNDKLVSDSEFRDALIYNKLYTKKKVCKFLLASIENEDSKEHLNIDLLTIEHILPQKEKALAWTKELGEDYDRVYSTYLHTLGNLTITGYNSDLAVKSFNDKKKIIRKYSKANILNRKILAADKWNEKAIIDRAEELAKKAIQIFDIEETEIIEKYRKLNDKQMYNLENLDIITGTTPIMYIFSGENVSVNSYANMLNKVIVSLYNADSSIMENLAKEKYCFTSGERVHITTNKSEINKSVEIENTGIYYEKNLSAKDILKFIKCLIEEYHMDTEDFEFICE